MKADPSHQPGDETLAGLLTAAGVATTPAELGDIIKGVIAAPAALDPAAWTELVLADAAGDAAGELIARLTALAGEARDAADYGLGHSPAPPERLDALRAELAQQGIDGFLVPVADEHQGEFPPPSARRLAWLTGFRGSAGVAAVLAGKAAIFVDGRYTIQVRDQVDTGRFEPLHLTESPAPDWIAGNAEPGQRIGYDPWLHTIDGLAKFREACARRGIELVALDVNPVDTVWRDRPSAPISPVVPHDLRYAGRDSMEKRREVAAALTGAGADAALLSAPDSIAWLLNLRGGDVPYAPLALCFAIIRDDATVELFIDERKLTGRVRSHLGSGVSILASGDLGAGLDRLGAAARRVRIASASVPCWVADRLEAAGAEPVSGVDPCVLPKACKNRIELNGARSAHLRDGVALCRFLAWLAVEAPGGGVDELAAGERIDALRAEGDLFRGLSFDTISGAGANGAIVHYLADRASNRKLTPGTLYLVDSGAQYLDGTTDVTRTIAIGVPEPEMRDRFTRVLKGHIAVACARFPAGAGGGQIDPLARTALWQAGLDFDHGAGHGVGSYLNVHEGPQRIAKRAADAPLKAGMVVSNEPGYYKTGAYGIRIENLLAVRTAPEVPGAELGLLEFETLTLAPIDRALVDIALMTADEIGWLDRYHARVAAMIGPKLDEAAAEWLAAATAPLAP